ncbi:hypothetical protein F4802DRAFT_542674 [Xylaria palmicola]|nr:hypothetical protein F4802DRAFT_542674 [Xylaria palmicola]
MHCFNFNPPTLAVAAVAFLSALPAAQAGLYPKSSPVLQVDAKNYERLIAKSNHTSVVEFYAPWCGHCQNLKPAYEKAAKNLDGLAKVAAINCDEDENKQLCGVMGVKGFPTLKIVRPGKKQGSKPVVEDYQGERNAKAIVNAVVDKINNHVKRVTDKEIDDFLSTNNETAKAILFTEKGTTSALLRSLAIDFLDVISFAQVRDKEPKTTELFGVESYPTFVLLPGGDKDGLIYQGEMKKPAMLKFLSQAGEPNPDPAPAKSKAEKKSEKKDKKDKKDKTSKASSSETTSTATTESSETTEVPPATESKPKVAEVIPPIPAITSSQALTNECFHPKAHICVLAFVPTAHSETAEKALAGLSEIAFKHARAERRLFPFFEVHTDNELIAPVFKGLELAGEVELVAVNAKRGWWRHYEGDFDSASVESWIDAIRMNEGSKRKLPEAVMGEVAQESDTATQKPVETVQVKLEEDVKIEVDTEPEAASWQGAEPTPEATDAPPKHEEKLVVSAIHRVLRSLTNLSELCVQLIGKPKLDVDIHSHACTFFNSALHNHLVSLLAHDLVQKLAHAFACVRCRRHHALKPANLNARLTHQHRDLVRRAERRYGQEGQLLLLLGVQVDEGVGALVAGRVRRGAAGGAGDEVVGHGHAGVNEGQGGGVDEGREERAVLREDVQRDADRGARVQVDVQVRGEGLGDGGLELLDAPGAEGGFLSLDRTATLC